MVSRRLHAGDNDVADAGVMAVAQSHTLTQVYLSARDAPFLGEAVEFRDTHVGVSHHQGLASLGVVGVPGAHDLLDQVFVTAGVDAPGGLVPGRGHPAVGPGMPGLLRRCGFRRCCGSDGAA